LDLRSLIDGGTNVLVDRNGGLTLSDSLETIVFEDYWFWTQIPLFLVRYQEESVAVEVLATSYILAKEKALWTLVG